MQVPHHCLGAAEIAATTGRSYQDNSVAGASQPRFSQLEAGKCVARGYSGEKSKPSMKLQKYGLSEEYKSIIEEAGCKLYSAVHDAFTA
jgi:hypothetical protein